MPRVLEHYTIPALLKDIDIEGNTMKSFILQELSHRDSEEGRKAYHDTCVRLVGHPPPYDPRVP